MFCLFSTLTHTSLRMFGGDIPESKYISSIFIGTRHHVISLHVAVSSGSRHVNILLLLLVIIILLFLIL